MSTTYKLLWYGNGGVGVVSKEYANCTDRDDAIAKFSADQGEHTAQSLIDAYKLEGSDKPDCAGCLALANEIRQLRNEVGDLRGAIDCYLDKLSQINELSSLSGSQKGRSV